MKKKKFVTAINCMDGRVQLPVIRWLMKEYQADYADMITEPGPIKIMAEGQGDSRLESIRKRVEISVYKHGSGIVALVGHYDCAGNLVDKDTQLKQINKAIKAVKTWDFQVQIIGLWVDQNWEVSRA